jgi:hypothetical protein
MVERWLALAPLWAALLFFGAVDSAAQTDLTLELGGSRIGPAVGAEGDDARFVLAGLRGARYATSGSGVSASVLFGRTLDAATGGSFLSGVLEGTLANRWTPSLSAELDARILGYGVEEPFPYRAIAAEGGPSLRYRTPSLSLTLAGLAGVGRSELELWRVEDGPSRVFRNDLWRAGGSAEVLLGPATGSAGVVAEWHATPSGDYRSVGARVVLAGGWGLAELRADRWITPFATESVVGVSLVVPLGSSWSVRGFFGRTDPDPLTLAQPGSGSGGVLVGRSLYASEGSVPEASSLHEIVRAGPFTARVRFTVEPPASPTAVAVLGDFTLWDPVAMTLDDGAWVVEMDVPRGTHHFGFLVDDEWYVPDDANDVAPDEWGRPSATLVIEGES